MDTRRCSGRGAAAAVSQPSGGTLAPRAWVGGSRLAARSSRMQLVDSLYLQVLHVCLPHSFEGGL